MSGPQLRVIAGLAAVLASGCMLGPDYARPTIESPASYRFDSPEARAARSLADVSEWWTGFGDPDLDALVRETLAANHDLRIATARVDEFAARAGVTRAQGLPQVGYGADAGRQGQGSNAVGNYSTVLSASWELDLWGRIRRENEAARADLFATEEARRGVALTLVSTVVSGYITLLELDRQPGDRRGHRRRAQGQRRTVPGPPGRRRGLRLRNDAGHRGIRSRGLGHPGLAPGRSRGRNTRCPRSPAAIPARSRATARSKTLVAPAIAPRPALRAARTAPRHPAGRTATRRRQRAHRRGARAVFPEHLADRLRGHARARELDDLFSGPARTWSFSGQLLGPIFSGGAIECHQQAGRSAARAGAGELPCDDPGRLPRRRRRAGLAARIARHSSNRSTAA